MRSFLRQDDKIAGLASPKQCVFIHGDPSLPF